MVEQLQALWKTNKPAQEVPAEWLQLCEKLVDKQPVRATPLKR